jgi:hypothetical protein
LPKSICKKEAGDNAQPQIEGAECRGLFLAYRYINYFTILISHLYGYTTKPLIGIYYAFSSTDNTLTLKNKILKTNITIVTM